MGGSGPAALSRGPFESGSESAVGASACQPGRPPARACHGDTGIIPSQAEPATAGAGLSDHSGSVTARLIR
jgi:hypothetical protein